MDGGIETHISLHVHAILQMDHDPLNTNLKESPCLLGVFLVGKDGGDGRHFEEVCALSTRHRPECTLSRESKRPTRKDIGGQDAGEVRVAEGRG